MKELFEDFVSNPSWSKLDNCKKENLLIIANYYDVSVPYRARKAVLKQAKMKRGVLSGVVTVDVDVRWQFMEGRQ